MSATPRHPPGREGRLWLRRRLTTARRGADLLDRKLRILRREEQRFVALADRTRGEWELRCREAEEWLLKAAVVAGDHAVRPDPALGEAEVEVVWQAVMGVRYPDSAVVRAPGRHPQPPVAGTAAVPAAAEAYRAAVQAAVAYAVAAAAAEVVSTEVATTRGRLRAIQDRWVPRLERALQALELTLDESERADAVRLRWAAGRLPDAAAGAGTPLAETEVRS